MLIRLLPPVHRHIVLHYLWSHQGVSAIDLKLLIQQPEDLSLELWVYRPSPWWTS